MCLAIERVACLVDCQIIITKVASCLAVAITLLSSRMVLLSPIQHTHASNAHPQCRAHRLASVCVLGLVAIGTATAVSSLATKIVWLRYDY